MFSYLIYLLNSFIYEKSSFKQSIFFSTNYSVLWSITFSERIRGSYKLQNIRYLDMSFNRWMNLNRQIKRKNVCLDTLLEKSNIKCGIHTGQFLAILVAWCSFGTYELRRFFFWKCMCYNVAFYVGTPFIVCRVKNHFLKTWKARFISHFQITFIKKLICSAFSDTFITFQNLRNGVYFTFSYILIRITNENG